MPPARRPRATSAAVSRTVTYDDAANEAFSATMGGGGGSPSRLTMSEEDYLQSQLKEVLRRQAEVDEAHQRGIIGFRHTLRQYYGSNAVLRQIISVAEKRRRDVSSSSRADGPATVTAAECEYLSQRSSLAVRRRNRVLHDVRVLEQSMEDEERLRRRDGSARHNSVADGRRAAEGEFVSGNRSVFLRVQKMERRLNEVLGMQRAVGVVLKGYQHNLDELEHDGTRYDVWMQLLEKEYGERHRDHVQLVHLYLNAVRDIQRAAADKELRLQQQRQVRVTKEKALAEKRLSVTHVLRETQRQEQRIVDLQHQLDEEAQLLESAEAIQLVLEKKRLRSRNATAIMNEDPLSATASSATELAKQAARLLEQDNLAGQTAEEEEKLAAYEKSFREMMKAAQVSRLDELADVFRSETVHQQQLLELVQERRVEHARLEEQVKSLRAEMSLLRCCGTTQPPTTSHALEDELRVFVREAHDELRQTTTTGEAKNVLVDDLLRGVNMLAAKLSAYRAEVAIPPLSRVDQDAPAIQHAVSMLTHKLIALADDATRRTSGQYKSGLQPPQTVKTTQIVLPENNTRIHISSGAGGVGGSGARQVANISSLAGKHLLNQRDQQRVMCASAMDDADSHDGTTSMGMGSTTRRSPSALTGLGAPSRRRVLLEDLLLLENGSDADSYNSSAEEDGSEAGTLGPSTRPTSASAASNVTASMAKSANRSRVGGRGGGGGGGASRRPVVVNSSDDPLQREEVKHMSALMETRERRRREKELRRRSEA